MTPHKSFIVERITDDAIIPTKGSARSAGYDLYATGSGTIYPGDRALIGTGIKMALARGLYGQIFPRSGLANKHGLMVMGGTIDNDYRGEIKVMLYNSGRKRFMYEVGDRLAQLVFLQYASLPMVEGVIDDTARGDGGFGSTGLK